MRENDENLQHIEDNTKYIQEFDASEMKINYEP